MQPSLVKYKTPILVSSGGKKAKAEPHSTETEDILNAILPPREWARGDELWVQYVSATPATRADVVKLQEQLDSALLLRQARETGICPAREELYSQAFEEEVRQVTIICAERGLLLLRVRDELRMTICAYQSLYESGIAFGMRKALRSEQWRANAFKLSKQLSSACSELESEKEALDEQIAAVVQREQDRRAADAAKHGEEVESMKASNKALKDQLEALLTAPKRS